MAEMKSKIPARAAPVLPWMRVPLTIDPGDGTLLENVGGLDPRLASALATAAAIEVLFPVQVAVWEATAGGMNTTHDICLAAPTGSGKTLAYALPLLSRLAARPLSALQALILLPTRDLALQVYTVIRPLCTALGITCCTACGQEGLSREAALLAAATPAIIVATPGRLITHLSSTPNFTLDHLEFLVVDEADRLLRQTYQNWLPTVLRKLDDRDSGSGSNDSIIRPTEKKRVQKFIVSATLTKDPSKLDRLRLQYPRYIAMMSQDREDYRFKLPPGLIEEKMIVKAEKKPHALVRLLHDIAHSTTPPTPTPTSIIIFTSAVESTRRLTMLLQHLDEGIIGGRAVEYSAALPPEERRHSLEAFTSHQASILVCSDAMTRGMDVDNVGVVINYDAPVYVKTYVHRAGRTARAGKGGRVVTLLRREDVRHFKAMLRKADNTYVKDMKFHSSSVMFGSGGEQEDEEEGDDDEQQRQQRRRLQRAVDEAVAAMMKAVSNQHPPDAHRRESIKSQGARTKFGGGNVKRRKLTSVPSLLLQD